MNENHLKHLLKKAGLDDAKLEELVTGQWSKDAGERTKCESAIKKAIGAVALDRLLREWRDFAGRRAVLLFQLESLRVVDFAGLTDKVKKAVKAATGSSTVPGDKWVEASPKPSGDTLSPRVARVNVGQDDVCLNVNLVQNMRIEREDDTDVEEKTVRVQLLFPKHRTHIVRVFANATHARRAIGVVHEWLLGETLPEKRKDRLKYLQPVLFSEQTAKKVAKTLFMFENGVVGDDPDGKNGRCEFNGKRAGAIVQRADLSNPMVAKHFSAAGRDARAFGFKFTHADGFEEHSRVQFVLNGRPPHLLFLEKTSRSATEQVVEALLVSAGV